LDLGLQVGFRRDVQGSANGQFLREQTALIVLILPAEL
jgi:hypothetical protein